jgi:hypothetical protein
MSAGSMLDTSVDIVEQRHQQPAEVRGIECTKSVSRDGGLLEAKGNAEPMVATDTTDSVAIDASSINMARRSPRISSRDQYGQGHTDQDLITTAATATTQPLDQLGGAHELLGEHEQGLSAGADHSQEIERSSTVQAFASSPEEAKVEAKALALELERQIAQEEMDVAMGRARAREIEFAKAAERRGDIALSAVTASERMQQHYIEAESMR